jgi:hypothetical protein
MRLLRIALTSLLALSSARAQAVGDFDISPDFLRAAETNTTVASYQAFVWRAFRELEPFYQRSDWGAEPRRGDPTIHRPLMVTIHHTETAPKLDAKEAAEAVRRFQYYHMFGRSLEKLDNFDDIGYHFLIDGSGRIFEGRPLDTLGAHAKGGNYANVGIALIGNFGENEPGQKQIESTAHLLTYLGALYRVSRDYEFINAHHDFVKTTTCPGKNIDRILPELRRQVDVNLLRLGWRARTGS